MRGMRSLACLLLLLIVTPASAERVTALGGLAEWMRADREKRPPLSEQTFAKISVDKAGAAKALEALWRDRSEAVREERKKEVKDKTIRHGDKALRYEFKTRGRKPAGGRSLYISMHGGGGAPARVNDQQWQNQIKLYKPKEGIYLAPRAPGDTWDLWHKGHIDPLYDRLIETLVVFEDVNPDKVYLMGYSAGGDGVYQLAPRMSDRFAGAAMMAGHPNETSPLGLRNIPFALQVGELDAAYKRNKIAAEWKIKLADLHKADPSGYENFVEVREGKRHWMDLEDKVALPWMAKFERRRFPDKVVWKQDDVTHSRSYWLALPKDQIKARQLVVASREGQVITVEKAEEVKKLTVMLNDEMLDLDQAVKVQSGGKVLFEGKVERTVATIARTLAERGDRRMVFCAEVTVELP